MKLFKMSIVQSIEFERTLTACQMAYGFVASRKKTLVWIATFEQGDYEIIRECLEEVGSKYKGTWRP